MRFLVVLLTLSSVVCADEDLDEKLLHSKVELGAGVSVSLIGVAMSVAGTTIFAGDFGRPAASPAQDRLQHNHEMASIGLGISAFVLCAIGIPLAVDGGLRMRALKRKLAVGPSSMGVSF